MESNGIKVYVPVKVDFREDGREYEIDRVADIRQAAAMRTGGQGDRYTIHVRGRQSYLFLSAAPIRLAVASAAGLWSGNRIRKPDRGDVSVRLLVFRWISRRILYSHAFLCIMLTG